MMEDLAARHPTPAIDAPRSRRKGRVRLVPAVPVVILGLFVIVAIAAPLLTPHDPVDNDLANSLHPPFWVEGGSNTNLLGTDSFGRDVLTRMIYGARVSFSVAAFSLLIALSIGTVVGVVAGYLGGWVDSVLMRLVDSLLALPRVIVALVIAVALGPSFTVLVLVLGFLMWPYIARLVRGEALLLRRQDYVRYSSAIGVGTWAVIGRHIVPNVLPTLLVATTLELASVILAEASLSFIGAGLPPPSASWGVMIADGQGLIATGWWIALFPGLAITVTVLSFNSFGDWLRDRLDPKRRQS